MIGGGFIKESFFLHHMDAYEVARELSRYRDNVGRRDFIERLARDLALSLGYRLILQDIDVDPKYGNRNFILDSGHDNPLLNTAHYDGYVIDEATGETTPGANDNGSGIGAVVQALQQLKGLPVDVVFFGAEEADSLGAKQYIAQMTKKIRAVVNLDTCGSGGKLGMLIPDSVEVGPELRQIDAKLNAHYLASAESFGIKICGHDPLAIGDHCNFIEAGIPATTIQGEDLEYYGMEDEKYIDGKGVMHTAKDTIEEVDREFLQQVVLVLIAGSKRLLGGE